MKLNQEITAKFWIALILFFAVALSSPLTCYLVDKNIISYSNTTGIYFICTLLFSGLLTRLSLKYSELEQIYLDLKTKTSKESFYKTVSMQTINDYEEQINAQETRIKEIKQAFEDAVVEITELRSMYNERQERIKVLGEQITYWKERALHQKHTKKEVDSEYWECEYNIYAPEFVNGNKYEVDKSKNSFQNTLFLIGESKCTCFVEKKYFKPVKP